MKIKYYICNKAGKFYFCAECEHSIKHKFIEHRVNCHPSNCYDGHKNIKVKCKEVK